MRTIAGVSNIWLSAGYTWQDFKRTEKAEKSISMGGDSKGGINTRENIGPVRSIWLLVLKSIRAEEKTGIENSSRMIGGAVTKVPDGHIGPLECGRGCRESVSRDLRSKMFFGAARWQEPRISLWRQ